MIRWVRKNVVLVYDIDCVVLVFCWGWNGVVDDWYVGFWFKCLLKKIVRVVGFDECELFRGRSCWVIC